MLTVPLVAASPLRQLTWILVDRFFSRSSWAMLLEIKLTCEPGSHRQRMANVLPLLSIAFATIVANSANALGLALAAGSQSVSSLWPEVAFTVARPRLEPGALFGGASHSRPLCLTSQRLHGRNEHFSTLHPRLRQFGHMFLQLACCYAHSFEFIAAE